MKAVYIEAHGGTEVLSYGDRPEPEIAPHEVKLRVRATALNRLDLYTREGGRGLRRDFPPPLILGGDCAAPRRYEKVLVTVSVVVRSGPAHAVAHEPEARVGGDVAKSQAAVVAEQT